jgi:hypothetical protein
MKKKDAQNLPRYRCEFMRRDPKYLETFRYRWEFMRRDPKYIEAFKRIEQLKEHLDDIFDDICLGIRFEKAIKITLNFSEPFPWNPLDFASELALRKNNPRKFLFYKIKKVFEEFGLNFLHDPFHFPTLPNPNNSFNELIPIERNLLLMAFRSNAVTIRSYIIDDKNKRINNHDCLEININFNEINSIEACKHFVNTEIDLAWKSYKVPFHYGYREKKKTNLLIDFNKILEVGALREKNSGDTWAEIGEIAFPNDGNSSSRPIRAFQHYERYQTLTKGGEWRNLKYP